MAGICNSLYSYKLKSRLRSAFFMLQTFPKPPADWSGTGVSVPAAVWSDLVAENKSNYF